MDNRGDCLLISYLKHGMINFISKNIENGDGNAN